MQTIVRKSRAAFGMCVTCSVPFILVHVSPQARSKVSVIVTGDQTIFVRLGAVQHWNHSVSKMLLQMCSSRCMRKLCW